MGTCDCYQRDGSILKVEKWVYEAWVRNTLKDPLLTAPLYNAVKIIANWNFS